MKICVITGSRAEYGLLEPLINKIKNDKELQLQLIVTGMHLHIEFGNTYKQIEKEYEISSKINLELIKYQEDIASSMAIANIEFSKAFNSLNPDLIIILGDRFEIFSVATVATILNIPIAHIHGGELTYGAIDDAFRHSITKMSHLHFTSTNIYKNRVIQMGENPSKVFNVGSLGVENIKKISLLSKKELEEKLKIKFLKSNILVTFHPETISSLCAKEQIKELLSALQNYSNSLIIFTKANADAGGIIINKEIEKFVLNNNNCVLFDSLGQVNYFSSLKFVDVVIGNSSSGIIEVPSFNIPTINIGARQEGRIQTPSTINIPLEKFSIIKALDSISKIEPMNNINPYEKKNCSDNIIQIIKQTDLSNILLKKFYDTTK